ncbi:MAG: O-antigen ligase family protein [Saprospiraceae bacterium]|nr:O-antigen ligase family protein [Saprospiraceae bacterium]
MISLLTKYSDDIKKNANQNIIIFWGFAICFLMSIFIGAATQKVFYLAIPFVPLFAYVLIVDFRLIFYLLLIVIPFSVEVVFSNGFGTDLPTEPLIILLTGIYILFTISEGFKANSNFIRHPLTLILLIHVSWIFIVMFTSSNFVVSLKFFLAKTWYVITFFFLAGRIIKDVTNYKIFFWCLFLPLATASFITLVRHYGVGLTFESVNTVMFPFFRNHVSYAAINALFLPYAWYAASWYKRWSFNWLVIVSGFIVILLAVQFSYTRAAYVAIFMAVGMVFVIKWKLTKLVVASAVIGLIILVGFLNHKSNYLEFAPNYNKTIAHKSFDNLLEATYKMEDISTMERVYRWVAGANMFSAKPLVGFGPGNFYNFYKSFTVSSFRTYVSDNPEKSGIHSYYLMTLVEQGIIGFILFLVLIFSFLIYAERVYHSVVDNIQVRNIVLSITLSMVIIDALLLINDMIETDKVGSFFFMNIAILININLYYSKKKSHSEIL